MIYQIRHGIGVNLHPLRHFFILALISTLLALPSKAATLLDDTFADGNRTSQSLPTDAAWFVSSAAAVSTSTGAMAFTLPSSSFFAISYFGTNSSQPVKLQIGDTLSATLKFTVNNLGAVNSSQGLRIGLFNFAESTLLPKWVTTDGFSTSSQGTNVQGYALFQNFSSTFSSSSPMDIKKRTTPADKDLLGASGDWTSLTTGPGSLGTFTGFANGAQYSLQLSAQRTDATSLALSVTLQNINSGATLTTSFTDSAASTFNFDGVAMRPAGANSVATNFVVNELRVDVLSSGTPASVVSDPQSQSVFTNQTATFTISATGSSPLNYQWYFNTNTAISYGTNATLTITNAQLTDAGTYYAIVTNAYGSDTSSPVSLTVTVPVGPTIITQPTPQTVLPGQTATLLVQAGGSSPLSYQWYFNTNTMLTNATDSLLTLTNVQASQSGMYSVVVSNFIGSITSSSAALNVNTNPVAPSFTSQPASQIVVAGGTAIFNAAADGTAPITYQWFKNGVALSGKTASTLTLANVQMSDAGSYTLVASNSVGTATSSAAQLTVTLSVPVVNSAFNIQGYGRLTTGGGVLPDTNANYAKIYTATDLANAINSKTVKIIEIMTNLSLGYNEIEASAKSGSEPFRADTAPSLHPVLLQSGVSVIDVQGKSGLTIFSANGATIKHGHLNVKNCGNVIIRNLKFDELWEWDELSKGGYDKKNWDFITVGDAGTCSNVWIDHCTFTKAYDGIVDIKKGTYNMTLSWCKYTGDDGATNPNSWVWQQINSLESNRTSYAFYNFLRNNGFSTTDIVTIAQGHDKTHLIGANDLDPLNAQHSITLHHEWFINPWDRLPRLRAGNVHDFNLYVDDTAGLAARTLRNTRAAAMSTANQNTLNNTYSFNPFLNGSISTEGGAVLVEKSIYNGCVTPLRNNQTDPSNPVYTGKILALDTIYQYNTTFVRGNSTDIGNPMGPFQAPIIPFSWNTNSSTPSGQLPYTYIMDDPSQLQAIITSPTAGAGAGVLTWAKTNWLITSYPATAPTIVAQPNDVTANSSGTANFIVVAAGSGPLSYQWYFNTNTPLASATNSTLSLTNLKATNAGTYSVVVTNSAGSVTSSFATLTVTSAVAPVLTPAGATYSGTGGFTLQFTASVGQPYSVWASSNLTSWSVISTGTVGSSPVSFNDPAATNFQNRYYRISTP